VSTRAANLRPLSFPLKRLSHRQRSCLYARTRTWRRFAGSATVRSLLHVDAVAMPVRLHFDGSQTLWALVRCDVCTDVHKYPAIEAAQIPIKCKKCGHPMDVRERLMAVVASRPEVPGELLSMLSAVSRPRP
jgi:hypothetical protein